VHVVLTQNGWCVFFSFDTTGLQVKLAVSLHAANDRDRSAVLPVNRRYPLDELMETCLQYVKTTDRRCVTHA
jgi:23S rRNA (adenine2503-C2)-methyltransferase